jgi:hypothetical protein
MNAHASPVHTKANAQTRGYIEKYKPSATRTAIQQSCCIAIISKGRLKKKQKY